MSELKVINAYQLTTNTEDSDVYIHNDDFCCGGDLVECYLKSEADKVIARHKYKRCLAMAKWCMTEYLHSKCLDFTNTEQWYWRRWYIRWRNLAKKFKEAKDG